LAKHKTQKYNTIGDAHTETVLISSFKMPARWPADEVLRNSLVPWLCSPAILAYGVQSAVGEYSGYDHPKSCGIVDVEVSSAAQGAPAKVSEGEQRNSGMKCVEKYPV
jgi:hypothetical protein